MTANIAITLPAQQIASARQAVAEGRASSISAYISQAMARRDSDEALAATLAKAHAGSGMPTNTDQNWARHTLGLDGETEDPWSLTR
jgi:hypothetical protein